MGSPVTVDPHRQEVTVTVPDTAKNGDTIEGDRDGHPILTGPKDTAKVTVTVVPPILQPE